MAVVDLKAARDQRCSDLWDAYVEARAQAERTASFPDGQRAARAWCAFIASMMSADQRKFCGGVVARFDRRA